MEELTFRSHERNKTNNLTARQLKMGISPYLPVANEPKRLLKTASREG